MSPTTQRYPGPRWSILYGAYSGLEKFAIEELQRAAQYQVPYVIEVLPSDPLPGRVKHALLAGTPESSPLIARLVQDGVLQLPTHPEGFEIRSLPAPWDSACRLVVIAAGQTAGVHFGVQAFISWILAAQGLAGLGDLQLRETPRVDRRGIWTWGYVIYDYRAFLDQMARLRFNQLTIWNDTPPLNCADVIEYAHARSIRVMLGFPWGWGQDYNLADPASRQAIEEEVVQHYREKIVPLHPDGIYFQTLTEHDNAMLDGFSVAALTRELVNRISARLFEITPGLEILYGLHATSIGAHYPDLDGLDQRITILWEDAGALPYAYTPTLRDRGMDFEATLAYSRQLATFRPGSVFGMVPKGWTCLDWANEFEHHGEYLLGLRSRAYIQQRAALKRGRWRTVNRLWGKLYPKAVDFYTAMVALTGGKMIVQGLVEDGLLENDMQPSLALFAETLWDPTAGTTEISRRAGKMQLKPSRLRRYSMTINVAALWDYDKPEISEQRFRSALPAASADETLILQTQIARTYGLRRNFSQAQQILAGIEPQIHSASLEAQSRYYLELGRTYTSAAHPPESQTPEVQELARSAFMRAFEIAQIGILDHLAIDALHMMTCVDTAPADQLEWNRKAVALMQSSAQQDARNWAGSLHNNSGYALHLLGRYDDALAEFKLALAAREREGNPQAIRIAYWMIAWTLRALNRLDEAIQIQLRLERECDAAEEPDPYVFEELEVLYRALNNNERADYYAARRKSAV
jgi:hypothetical protein